MRVRVRVRVSPTCAHHATGLWQMASTSAGVMPAYSA